MRAEVELVENMSKLYSALDLQTHSVPSGLILGLHPANDRRRYKVTPSLIGWVQT